MACSTGNPFGDFFAAFFSFIGNPIGTILDIISKAVLAAAINVFASLTARVPTLSGTESAEDVSDQSQWVVIWLAVGSLLFAAARMAIERRGDAGVTAMKGIFRVILVSAAATTVVTAAANISDDYSSYLFREGAMGLLESIGCNNTSVTSAFLTLILAFLLLIAGIIHTILLYIRLGVMIVLLGTLPLAAAASMTDWGAGWWRKHIGWMIAWLIYKPAAALVMYAGQAMIASSKGDTYAGIAVDAENTFEDPAAERIAGIAVMLLSAVALPALLKLIVPATAALGGGSFMSNGMSMALGGVASGARAVGGMAAAAGGGASGGASGGGGKSGPSGAVGGGGGSGSDGNSGSSGADGGGGSGSEGKSGSSGGGGGSDSGGKSGPSGSGGGSSSNDESGSSGGGSGKGGGAGKVAVAAQGVAAVANVAQKVMQATGSALDDADGNRGHNT